MDNILGTIRTKYGVLSASQQQVADYVLANAEKVMTSSVSDLAAACGVSDPTIFRFLKKLDCPSYQTFRVNIAQELSRSKADPIYDDVTENDGAQEVMDKVIQSTACAIQDLSTVIDAAVLEAICEKLCTCRSVLIIGIGASAAPAFDLHHKLLKLGLRASFCHDPHMINIAVGTLDENDLLVAFSHSGESREMLDGMRLAKKRNVPVAAITSYPRSTLSLGSDYVLLSSSKETRFRSDSMVSRIIQMTLIDMIYIRMALKMGDEAMTNINRSRVAVAGNKT